MSKSNRNLQTIERPPDLLPVWSFFMFSDGSNYARSSMFDRLKPKIGCLSSITKRWTHSSPFNVRKDYVRVCSLNNSVKAFWVWCSFVQSQNSGVRVWSLIDEHVWVCSMFKNDVRIRSMFDKMVFNPSLLKVKKRNLLL